MTVIDLQKALLEEMKQIFSSDIFKDSTGKYVSLNVFEQWLPIRKDEDEQDPVPYIIVRIEVAEVKGWTEAQVVETSLLIGCFDDDTNNVGHKTVLEIIQRIEERFFKNPMLASQFMFLNDDQHPFDWALQDEESFPYYFGAVRMYFNTPAIRKEDKYA